MAAQAPQLLVEVLGEQQPVGEAGECVVCGRVPQLPLRVALGCEVGKLEQDAAARVEPADGVMTALTQRTSPSGRTTRWTDSTDSPPLALRRDSATAAVSSARTKRSTACPARSCRCAPRSVAHAGLAHCNCPAATTAVGAADVLNASSIGAASRDGWINVVLLHAGVPRSVGDLMG